MSKNINPNGIVLSFVWFFAGMVASFFAINTMVVEPHANKSNQIVSTVVADAKKLEHYGALTMVTQCKQLGYAFVEYDNNKGYVIDCSLESVAEVSGDDYRLHKGQFKEFASKLSNRPLVTPKLNANH